MRPEIVVIAAFTPENRLMGNGLVLPWPSIPDDLRRFKRLTYGHALVLGRRTHEGIIQQFGRLLPGRRTMVLTSRGSLPGCDSVETFTSLPDAIAAAQDEERIFIGGGVQLFEEGLLIADRLELTWVDGTYEGDTHFPEYWHLVGRTYSLTAIDVARGCRFLTLLRQS